MARRVYVIGEEVLPTKQAVETRVKAILWGADMSTPLPPQDERFMLGLLARHRHVADKIGRGMKAMHVRPNPAYPHQRTFYLERRDGTMVDFSYRQCLYPTTPLQDISQALRRAIDAQILAYKTRVFGGRPTIVCPVTARRCAWEDVHIDHRPPLTFVELVKGFCLSKSFVPHDIELQEAPDGIGSIIADWGLSLEWQAYHRMFADLWAISIEAHVALTRERLNTGKMAMAETNHERNATMTPTTRTIQTAWTHIHDRTIAGISLETFRAGLHDPQVQKAEARVNTLALANDVPGTQAACQAWNQCWQRAIQRRTAQEGNDVPRSRDSLDD